MNTEKLDKLVERINAQAKADCAFDRSEDSALAEFVSDLGYNECEYSTDDLTDEARELLSRLSKAQARKAVLECSHVELVGMHVQDNEVFSGSLDEQEHQFDDDIAAELKALTAEEFEYVRKHVSETYISDRYRDLHYINHGFDRWVLILSEEKLEAWIKKLSRKARKAGGAQ